MVPDSLAVSPRLSLKQRFHLDRFFKGEAATDGPILLSHRRIFILPTRAGLFFALILAMMLLASIVYNNNLGFLLTFLVGSVSLVSILHNFRTLNGLSVRAGPSEPVFAGQVASYLVFIENESGHPRVGIDATLASATSIPCIVPAQAAVQLALPLPSRNRGWLRPETITLSSRFPIGLFRCWSPLKFSNPVLVYPRPSERRNDSPEHLTSQGPAQSRLSEAEDFFGLHEYRAGDSVRHIHWKAYAKGHGLVTKHYGGAKTNETWFDLEQTPGESLEIRISQLCRDILDAERVGTRYGLKLPGYTKYPNQGTQHQADCLKALALF